MADGTCDKNDEDCLSPIVREPWETDFATLVPRFTGLTSTLCSALIIVVILRSHKGLTTIYHRIMFGMSVSDIISSFSISLTSLPMPSHMPKEEEFGYHWAGARLGNTNTCTAQGFFVSFGLTATFAYNGSLCLYYACTIALAMKEARVKTYVEPILHIWPIGIAFLSAILPLFYDMYNPGNSTFAWCAGLPYPEECTYDESVECLRGSSKAMGVLRKGLVVLIVFDFSLIFITMVMVIAKAIKINGMVEMVYKKLQARNDSAAWHEEMNFRHHLATRQSNVKATIIHALSYILAFLIVLMIPLLVAVDTFPNPFGSEKTQEEWETRFRVDKAMLVLMPLQGFLNFFIFISLKVYSYRQVHREVSVFQALVKVLLERIQEPCYISRISIVNHDRNDYEVQDDNNFDNNYNVDINLTEGCYEQGNKAGTAGADEKKIFVFLSMSDESGNSDLRYRIKLFTSDFQQQASSYNNTSSSNATSRERDGDKFVDIEMDQESKSDAYASLPRISYSMKSDSTIQAEEERRNYIVKIFNDAFQNHLSNHDTSVNKRNMDQSGSSGESVDHQSNLNDDCSSRTSRISEHLNGDHVEEERKVTSNSSGAATSKEPLNDSKSVLNVSIDDSDLEFVYHSAYDSKISYSVTTESTTNAEKKNKFMQFFQRRN